MRLRWTGPACLPFLLGRTGWEAARLPRPEGADLISDAPVSCACTGAGSTTGRVLAAGALGLGWLDSQDLRVPCLPAGTQGHSLKVAAPKMHSRVKCTSNQLCAHAAPHEGSKEWCYSGRWPMLQSDQCTNPSTINPVFPHKNITCPRNECCAHARNAT